MNSEERCAIRTKKGFPKFSGGNPWGLAFSEHSVDGGLEKGRSVRYLSRVVPWGQSVGKRSITECL